MASLDKINHVVSIVMYIVVLIYLGVILYYLYQLKQGQAITSTTINWLIGIGAVILVLMVVGILVAGASMFISNKDKPETEDKTVVSTPMATSTIKS